VLDTRARARLVKSKSARMGGAIIAALAIFVLLGPAASHHGPLESDFVHGVGPDGLPVGPNARFLLGADRLFRDVLARLAYAGRLSLLVALASTAMASVIGAVVGVLAGWHEGRPTQVPWPAVAGACGAGVSLALGRPGVALAALAAGAVVSAARLLTRPRARPVARGRGPSIDIDGLLMRFVDVMLAFPFLLLVMAIGAALDRASATTVFVTLGATSWLGIARVLRAKTIQVRSLDYVIAARALGRSTLGILRSHVLPNIAGPLVVTATMQVAQMIVADSVLSYLGVGISPPTPTWGRMLYEGQDAYVAAPWLVVAPGAAILLAVWGFNMLGEGLRDALDPNEV
jgi:ABC-type dipeptide/oligopeptide/nickel transport system permease subunit